MEKVIIVGRRRKKYKKIIRKVRRIPSVFQCPNCGSRSLTIELGKELDEEGRKLAVIRCGNCGLRAEMRVPEIYETVDVYGKFIDMFTEGTIEITFVKKTEEEALEISGEMT